MRNLLFLFIIILPINILSQNVDHYESIIYTGVSCKYLVPDADIGQSWKYKEFDDNSWATGISGVGYGDGDDNTKIESGIHSLYLRYSFEVLDLSDIQRLVLDADYDDGFIAYLNGTEIARANVDDPVSWNMDLVFDHEAKLYEGGMPERFPINTGIISDLLLSGENILAIEVHNRYNTSSDLSSNFYFHAGIASSGLVFSEVPEWFWEPVFFDSFNIPLMIINTSGQAIPDEPRIIAQMGLINNGIGISNHPEDTWNEYDGNISIETRGESSAGFEKKSYSIELQNSDGSNNNVSILGLPIENDFVLYAPYSDKTLMRNVLVYKMYNEMDNWAPRTRYIELLLNGDYRGVYILTEKLKRDENRVDIDKIDSMDVSSPEITGGYILRRDKTNDMEPFEYWSSPVDQIYYEPLKYQYFDPDYFELTPEQRQYIRDYMQEYDEMMSGPDFDDPVSGYRSYIDVKSFVDMLIINEISKGIDNYMFSTYFFKQNDEDGGKFFAGPPWDYNISLGNLNYGYDNNIPYTHSWVYDNWSRVYWWKRLLEDPWFENEVFCRWDDLRTNVLSNESFEYFINHSVNFLGAAVERNFEKFKILGTYIWPNETWPETYEEEIINMKSWISDRLEWMDSEWADRSNNCSSHVGIKEQSINKLTEEFELSVRVRPNPSDLSNTFLDIYTSRVYNSLTIEILDMRGILLERITDDNPDFEYNVYKLPDMSNLSKGIYLLRILNESQQVYVDKLIKSN